MTEKIQPESEMEMIPLSEIKEMVECSVCFHVPESPPIYQCDNGHILCKACKAQLAECTTCRQRLGNLRSLVAEKLIEKIPVRCKFAEHGCDAR
jgi:E3 ubiquitin-protein ligase SIAH1